MMLSRGLGQTRVKLGLGKEGKVQNLHSSICSKHIERIPCSPLYEKCEHWKIKPIIKTLDHCQDK